MEDGYFLAEITTESKVVGKGDDKKNDIIFNIIEGKKLKIKDIVIDKLGVDETKVTSEAKFIDDLGADSLDTVELIMQFEDDFNVEIPDEDAEQILSVGQAVEYVNNKR